MAPPVKIARCFGCKKPFSSEHEADDKNSAYAAECRTELPSWRVTINGKKQCQCSGCHELFTTPRTFDSHQTLREGKLVCKDPRRMFRASDHVRLLVLTTRGWAKNPSLDSFDTFGHKER